MFNKTSSIIPRKKRVGYSEAEDRFRNFIKREHPELKVTKKGLPDFMILKKGKVVGFVEVKDWLPDNLKREQILFKDFCREHNIPYQVWRVIMDGRFWKEVRPSILRSMEKSIEMHERFKRVMAWGDEIWEKI